MAKTCVICGKSSGMYPLCVEHLKAKNEGKVVKCEECKTWHYIDKPCQCNPSIPLKEEIKKKEDVIEPIEEFDDADDSDELFVSLQPGRCMTCGEEADGKFFCKACYFKYKGKNLYLKISKCSKVKILDDEYESDRICEDGHVVKSKSEREIDNYLYSKNIRHAYEYAVSLNDGKTIYPDFYLPDADIYIEHWGYGKENKQYTKAKEYKLQKYKELGYTVICTYEETDSRNLSASLRRKLNPVNYKIGEINFVE